ncbi:GIN domain-containing protein [Mucilaginibacter ginsenosidivorans]|uniref:Putative auto-transporter adhesin head GIN domain-containing protein n=1 Tax=Mucilaginibacter ginsenosidivorans TaxID=398053 RepID=A0A5B8UX18_9SPHI|nr:DUF2807 domain-containing protein [Mucilaginibacter ginsenosidivorans]QEC63482.1 hypothetical protein FRZ54_13135 [Mucilaginibacter ginsenosidivorans]
MKTKILSLTLLAVVLAGFTKNTYAAASAGSNYTVLNDIKAINKIEVRGNVELFISDNAAEKVTVYNKYYAESALVQSKNGVLRISSYTPEKLVVWVSSESLRSVSAFDNAEIKSFGKVSKIEFNIDLHDNASAKLDFDAYSANVTLRDNATIELSGTVEEFGVNRTLGSMVINKGLSVAHNNENKIVGQAGKVALAGLE